MRSCQIPLYPPLTSKGVEKEVQQNTAGRLRVSLNLKITLNPPLSKGEREGV